MLMIRLQRVGRKHEPVFRLVLTDSKNGPKSGKFLEILGHFDARQSEKAEFKIERVKQLISTGAKLSDTVHNLLVERKHIEGKKINNLPKKKPIVSEKAADSAPSSQPSQDASAGQAVELKEEAPVEPEVPVSEASAEPTEAVVEEKSS